MLSVEQALEKILTNVAVLEAEERPILDCIGQVLAEDVNSTINIPPLDNSAMDGYAVRSEDTRQASPASFARDLKSQGSRPGSFLITKTGK